MGLVDQAPHPITDIDDVVHQRVRLGILSMLQDSDVVSFVQLKQALELSDGNLNRHLAVLADAGFVTVHKQSGRGQPRTIVAVTPAGRRAYRAEISALRQLLERHEQQTMDGARRPARQSEQVVRSQPTPASYGY